MYLFIVDLVFGREDGVDEFFEGEFFSLVCSKVGWGKIVAGGSVLDVAHFCPNHHAVNQAVVAEELASVKGCSGRQTVAFGMKLSVLFLKPFTLAVNGGLQAVTFFLGDLGSFHDRVYFLLMSIADFFQLTVVLQFHRGELRFSSASSFWRRAISASFSLTSSLKKYVFYNLLINNILCLCVT